MRIPLFKTYRAFPELDRFSDEECRRYLEYVLKNRGGRRRLMGCLLAPVIAILILGSVIVSIFAGNQIDAWIGRFQSGFGHDHDLAGYLIVQTALLMGMGIGVLVLFDCSLRRILFAKLKDARCSGCGYSLLGLTSEAPGRVKCPECGQMVLLAEQQLTEEDLSAPLERLDRAIARADAPQTISSGGRDRDAGSPPA